MNDVLVIPEDPRIVDRLNILNEPLIYCGAVDSEDALADVPYDYKCVYWNRDKKCYVINIDTDTWMEFAPRIAETEE